jgi:hypothetical protein
MHVLEHLEGKLNAAEVIAAIKAYSYSAYQNAARNGHIHVLEYLLSKNIKELLAHAEMHDQENGKHHIYDYINTKLEDLAHTKAEFEQVNPNGVFDISDDEAQYYYFMLRNLIRRGVDRDYGRGDHRPAENLNNEIRFLLSVPAIRNLCHQAVDADEENQGQENELLRLANRLGNIDAAGILLQVPEVMRIARENNYYQDEVAGDINLEEVAQNRESSMVALAPAEREMLSKLKSHYDQVAENKLEIFEELKADLRARYEANPAQLITTDQYNQTHFQSLPLEWQDLEELRTGADRATGLSDAQYQAALKAYYQHPVHTAYRYLSRPNYFMHPGASYVYVNENDRAERWSTFEEYIELITLLYVAAKDESMAPTQDFTLEGRIALFFQQLAYIGRAHNWDNHRDKLDENGNQLLDQHGQVRREQYDDLTGDRPSCYSGVNRRLFQSLLGHPLFGQSSELYKQAINEQVRAYYADILNELSLEELGEVDIAYQGLIDYEGDMQSHIDILSTLNLSQEVKDELINQAYQALSSTLPSLSTNEAQIKIELLTHLNHNPAVPDFSFYDGVCHLYSVLSIRIDTIRGQLAEGVDEEEETKGDGERPLYSKQGAPFTMFSGRPSSMSGHSNKEQAAKETTPSPGK